MGDVPRLRELLVVDGEAVREIVALGGILLGPPLALLGSRGLRNCCNGPSSFLWLRCPRGFLDQARSGGSRFSLGQAAAEAGFLA